MISTWVFVQSEENEEQQESPAQANDMKRSTESPDRRTDTSCCRPILLLDNERETDKERKKEREG